MGFVRGFTGVRGGVGFARDKAREGSEKLGWIITRRE